MSFDVRGQTAMVTGANRGIGRAITEALLENGAAKVYAGVRRPETLAEMVETWGDRLVALPLEMTDAASIAAAAAEAPDVTLVVNNAGVLRVASPLAPEAIDALREEMEVNVYGLLRVAQAFAPVLAANGGGALVQLNSVASHRSFADFATYSASKAAADSLTQALRDKLKAQGTRVLSVHPGPVLTDMAKEAGLGEIAEPVTLVSEGIIRALADGDMHLFPDSMAQSFWAAYEGFAKAFVEADMAGE